MTTAALVRLCESEVQRVEARAVVADEGEPQPLSYLSSTAGRTGAAFFFLAYDGQEVGGYQ